MKLNLGIATALLCLALTAPSWAEFEDGKKAIERGDYAAAFNEFLPLAKEGHAAAQNYLGFMYAAGRGVTLDLS